MSRGRAVPGHGGQRARGEGGECTGMDRADRYPGCAGGERRLREGERAGLCACSGLSVVSMAGRPFQCRSLALSSPPGRLSLQTFAPWPPSLRINKTAAREGAAGRSQV